MLKYLKKTSKLILSTSWWIHLFACSTGQVKMSMVPQVGIAKTSVQNHQAEGAANFILNGHEFDSINHKLSKGEYKKHICKGLENVNNHVKYHPDFQNLIPCQELIKHGLLVSNRENLSISDENKKSALKLCSYDETNWNSSMAKVVYFLDKSIEIMDSKENPHNTFSSWKCAYTDVIKTLNGANQPIITLDKWINTNNR